MTDKQNAMYIIAVRKDNRKRINEVKVLFELNEELDTVFSRQEMIVFLKSGSLFYTAFENDIGLMEKGSRVIYYLANNNEEYLKTNVSLTAQDNLDNLPQF